jgi:hypothetical protein
MTLSSPCKATGLIVWALESPTVLPPNHSPIDIR